MKNLIFISLIIVLSSCDKTEEFEKEYSYPESIRVLTLDGDTVIIDNMTVQHSIGDHQIKIKKQLNN